MNEMENNFITKTHIISADDGNYTFYSFNDGTHKYIFRISLTKKPYLDVYEGIDVWSLQALNCKNHEVSLNKDNTIDWLSYRFDKLNYPEPFTNAFKKYAQSIVKLQAFC